MKIYLYFKHKNPRICNLIKKLNFVHDPNSEIALKINYDSLELYHRYINEKSFIKIDFVSKKNNYRCRKSRENKEILSKVVGIKKNYFPLVVDATAGLGRDAFILSFLGCRVIMIERHPIVMALLQDGLDRAYQDKEIGFWLKKRLHLIYNNSINMLTLPITQPDVIYLDPMYPIRNKKSLPKKEMQLFQQIIQDNHDSSQLLNISRHFAKKRVIVKRPCYAQPLSHHLVDFVIKSKKHRFDIYNPVKKTGVHIF